MDRIELEFHADTGGTSPMTWGQQAFWGEKIKPYGDASRHFTIPIAMDLPDDVTADVATVTAALRRLVERNEALRSHFLDGPEGPLQRVARTGTFSVLLHQAPREASRSHAEALAAELATAPFRHEAEWGIRLSLVCDGQEPRHLAFAISHLVADGGAIRALLNDFFALLRVKDGDSGPAWPWQPADQARREQSEGGARRSKAAIGYWRRQLERIPPTMFPWPALPVQPPRFQRLRMDSRALGIAATRLAANCQASMPSAVLAGAALALTALNGLPACALVVVVGNRYNEGLRSMVGQSSQDGLLVVDLAGGSVADVVRAVQRSVMTAFFYGHYDPAAREQVVDAVEAQRGVRFDLTAMYNDLSSFVDGAADEEDAEGMALTAGEEAQVRDRLRETILIPEGTWEGQHITMYLGAIPSRGMSSLHLVADTACLPPPAMAALLLGIEKIVTEAAYRDIAVADIPALTGLSPLTG